MVNQHHIIVLSLAVLALEFTEIQSVCLRIQNPIHIIVISLLQWNYTLVTSIVGIIEHPM